MSRILIALITLYRRVVSPMLPRSCRYEPTCSAYALDALRRFGAIKGSGMALRRIARCHPWAPGGIDPVPDRKAV